VGRRKVYPPQPDADGKFLLSELIDWFDFMDWAYLVNSRVCVVFGAALKSMSVQDALRANGCLNELEDLMSILAVRHPGLIPVQQRCKDLCAMLLGELLVCCGDVDCLRIFSKHVAGSADRWQSLSRALTENRLFGQKDWRQASSPAKWVSRTTNNIAAKESRTSRYAVDPAEGPETVPLEEIAELPVEALLEKKYTYQSVAQLEAAANEDPEVAEYLACKIRNPAWSRDAIWHQLGWDDQNGERVDRRYRRLRRRLRELGVGIQCREYSPPAGVSDASCTVYYEELFDGIRGKKTGVWQHRNPRGF